MVKSEAAAAFLEYFAKNFRSCLRAVEARVDWFPTALAQEELTAGQVVEQAERVAAKLNALRVPQLGVLQTPLAPGREEIQNELANLFREVLAGAVAAGSVVAEHVCHSVAQAVVLQN